MNWKNVRLIFQREFRDQLRDRRTLFMVVVLPLLLYPGLAVGMMQASFLFREQPRTVVLLGAVNLPEQPQLLNGDRFAAQWFPSPGDVERLHVIDDLANPDRPKDEAERANQLLSQARGLRDSVEQLENLESTYVAALKAQNQSEAEGLAERIHRVKEEVAERFTATRIQVLVVVPAGLNNQIKQTNQQLASREKHEVRPSRREDALRVLIVENSADEKSTFAYQGVKQVFAAWERQILQERLTEAKLPPTLSTPVNPAPIDVAATKQLSANLWSKLFPTLLILMAVTGAFYPAVDLAAGEKERGTMETLLICPARRSEIVLGKFFTVISFSISTVLLNLMSMGITGKYLMAAARSEAMVKMGAVALAFPGAWELLWLLILLLPLAAFYSAVSLALATFARSTKEGQYYLTPLLLVTLGLTLFCLSPAVEIEPFYTILPVVGPALLLKDVLASPGNANSFLYAIPVLVTSVGYSLIGLWWAINMFSREDVLFREAERFDVRLWIRHLLRDKDPTPSAAEAIICIVLIMLLQLVALPFMRSRLITADGGFNGEAMLRLLLMQQLVLVACPALFMGIILTTSVVRTLRLRLPSWEYLAMAVVLPLALHPLIIEVEKHLSWFFPPVPKHVVQIFETMKDPSLPLWLVLAAMAAAPAICEETAFRGFILSGFSRGGRLGLGIILSSLAFGLSHMIPQQVFFATILGLLLALLAVRSNSLLPGVLFHLIHNGLEVLRIRASAVKLDVPKVVGWFATATTTPEGEVDLHYHWTTVAVGATIGAALIVRLLSGFFSREGETIDREHPIETDRASHYASSVAVAHDAARPPER